MQLQRRWVIAAVTAAATVMALAAPAARADDALARIQQSHKIRIAVPTDYPPYGFAGTDLQTQGLDIDVARLVAQKLGVEAELVPVTSANRIPYLQTAQVDLVVSTLGKNEERMKVIDFTHAYAPFFQAAYALKSAKLEKFADLNGMSIAVAKGAMEESELTKVGPAGMDFKRYDDQASATAAFVSGQTQVLATSVSNAALMIEKNPSLGAELKLIIKESPCFIGVAKGQDPLRSKVNDVLLAAMADGTLDDLSKKWLGKSVGDLPLSD